MEYIAETGIIEDLKYREPSRQEVWKMFDRIAHRYDLLNRLLSFGQDVVWRRGVTRYLPDRPGQQVLDLATGTADLLISLVEGNHRIDSAVGIDMAEKMLEIGRQKLIRRGLDGKITLQTGNVLDIPFPAGSFDAVTIAFGIRNVTDVSRSLEEMFRVLKTGGRVIILEFSLPNHKFLRSIYLFYFRKILPTIGSLISGDSQAYHYLNQTVESFPYGEAFGSLLEAAGFSQLEMSRLTFGIATIYRAEKS